MQRDFSLQMEAQFTRLKALIISTSALDKLIELLENVLYGEIEHDEGVCTLFDHIDEILKNLRSFCPIGGRKGIHLAPIVKDTSGYERLRVEPHPKNENNSEFLVMKEDDNVTIKNDESSHKSDLALYDTSGVVDTTRFSSSVTSCVPSSLSPSFFFSFFFFLLFHLPHLSSVPPISAGSINMDNALVLFPTPKEIETANKIPPFVDTFYNLVTDIYEWGWGQSFHFSPSIQGKSHRDATRIHEEMAVDLLGVKAGD
ncbi:unnamed protein product [Cuscuta campestris]|uniref:SAM-dependent methyltransferase Erg6/SMT-type domain-containing protein n=1 Tax=Cuscuta campestris TaxID=132261 RepID=A0A484LWL8_9ASTE|nr:unnamed protein product [Cuscuta campestris]